MKFEKIARFLIALTALISLFLTVVDFIYKEVEKLFR